MNPEALNTSDDSLSYMAAASHSRLEENRYKEQGMFVQLSVSSSLWCTDCSRFHGDR